MDKWICILCGNTHRDEVKELPRFWVCPSCGGNKDYYFKDGDENEEE